MAIITDLTGNARYSILGIVPLFLLGLIIFLSLPKIENKSFKRSTEKFFSVLLSYMIDFFQFPFL